jgi:hypothetical protein
MFKLLIMAPLEDWQRLAPTVIEQYCTCGGCYRLELVKCGKAGCKCANSQFHSPYLYRYT